MRSIAVDDRAVSTTIGYALSLGISALLISGLLIAGGGFLQDQRVTSTRSELTVIGHQIAADIASADRLTGSSVTNIRVRRNLPERVTGSSYTVNVSRDPQPHLELTSAEPEVVVNVDIAVPFMSMNRDGVKATSVDGGTIEVVLDAGPDGTVGTSDDQLVVQNV